MQLLRRVVLLDQRSRVPHERISRLLLRLDMEVVILRVDQDSLSIRVQKKIRIECSAKHQRRRHLPVAQHLTPGRIMLRTDVPRDQPQFLHRLRLKVKDHEATCLPQCLLAPHLVELQDQFRISRRRHPFSSYATLSTTALVLSESGLSAVCFAAGPPTFFWYVHSGPVATSSAAPFFFLRFGKASWLFGQTQYVPLSFATSSRYALSHFGQVSSISFRFDAKSHFG